MGKGINLVIKIVKEVGKANKRAKKEASRNHLMQQKEQAKRFREAERMQKLYVQEEKVHDKRMKQIAKEELERLKNKENKVFEKRCKERRDAKQKIVNSILR